MTFAEDVECRDRCIAPIQSPPSSSTTTFQPPRHQLRYLREDYGLYHRNCKAGEVAPISFPVAERRQK
jgi:hypothetical protein